MSVVVLDSTPLGILCHPRNPPHVAACRQWLASLEAAGRRVVLPEIIDYEVRRELLRLQDATAIGNLDLLNARLDFLPLTSAACAMPPSCGRNPGKPDYRRQTRMLWIST